MTLREEWREIEDVKGYFVSDRGRVRGKSGRILKPKKKSNGYLFVTLCRDSRTRIDRHISRLVCTAFHGTPPEGFHADHKNNKRADNRATNLRWLSPQENRSLRKFRVGGRSPLAKLSAKNVRAIRKSKRSSPRLAEQYGVSARHIRRIKEGKKWTHLKAD